MKLTKEQIKFLEKVTFGETWKVNEKGEVDVDDGVTIRWNALLGKRNLGKIPVKFGSVNGSFDCSDSGLTTLENCPNIVNGVFNCSRNLLTSLDYFPNYVSDKIFLQDNSLTEYFKNKHSEFKHWDGIVPYFLLQEYPFLINVVREKMTIINTNDNFFREIVNSLPQTKIYLK